MAEPLKNSFGPGVPKRLAKMISTVYPDFNSQKFLKQTLDGYEDLELTQRAKKISAVLADTLPEDREHALEILIESLDVGVDADGMKGMDSLFYFPHVYFVAEQGLDCFETSMRAQYELTQRFTAEFSIRAFLEKYPEKTLKQLRVWASDPNEHVRRLVSEGSRPRLPWAPRLRRFQEDPAPVLKLLELLKDDPEEYVRRSVANNLNDISKDHPDVVLLTAKKWWDDDNKNRTRMLRHGLRTLIKQGNKTAIGLLGYASSSPAKVVTTSCKPSSLKIGEKVRIETQIKNPTQKQISVLVDFRVFFVKADGASSPKMFKGGEKVIEPLSHVIVGKTISLAQHSTRKHYVGTHKLEVVLNGTTFEGTKFELS